MIVYWQESDLSNFDAKYAATLADKFDIDFTPTATADVTAETATLPDRSQFASATSDSGEGAETSGSQLGSGAKAGIGIGVAIGAILLGITGFLLYKRRLRKKLSKLDWNSAIQNEQPELVQTQAA
jgi:hypothetical protein